MLYFSVVPDTGSYVFNVSVARMESAAGAAGAGVGIGVAAVAAVVVVLEVAGVLGLALRGLGGLEASTGWAMVYFVVMRV